jgi:hypothetical protein
MLQSAHMKAPHRPQAATAALRAWRAQRESAFVERSTARTTACGRAGGSKTTAVKLCAQFPQ